LLAAGELPVALWVAYPHQNLGALEEAFGRGEERQRFLEALARLADLPEPALPRFGPFAAPPSRELVALSDEAGERVLVAARVYPALAAVARLAGRVAGNPWLAGGEVDAFGGPAEVAWDGTLWTVGNVPLAELLPAAAPGGAGDGESSGEGAGEAVAVLRLERPVSFLPAGRLRLAERDGGLEVSSAGGLPVELDLDGPAAAGVALLAVSGPDGPLQRQAGGGDGRAPRAAERGRAAVPRGAFALFPGAAGGDGLAGMLGSLPGAAVWYRPGGERFRLPVERLLRGAGLAERGNGGGWAMVATSRAAAAAAEPLSPLVERWSADASLALVADPGAALAAVEGVTDVLDLVPLVSGDEVRRWRDWRTVLAPLGAYRRLTLVSVPAGAAGGGGSGALRLRLEGAEPGPRR
jgi:hypothetical protein